MDFKVGAHTFIYNPNDPLKRFLLNLKSRPSRPSIFKDFLNNRIETMITSSQVLKRPYVAEFVWWDSPTSSLDSCRPNRSTRRVYTNCNNKWETQNIRGNMGVLAFLEMGTAFQLGRKALHTRRWEKASIRQVA